jgi:drug/metabolite transporter (DMT)-like permease
MEWLWIPITIGAAVFQALRTALQKFLKGKLSTNGATFTRFFYGMPVAVAYVFALTALTQQAMPQSNLSFWLWVVAGGVSQIIATSLMLHVLSFRNFPVGVAYTKTEVLQAAIFGLVFLGDRLSAMGTASVALGTFGVMLVSLVKSDRPIVSLLTGWLEKPALIGMLSGSFFAVSAVGFRGASLSLGYPDPLVAAAYTLAWANTLQVLMLGAWLLWRERDQFGKVIRTWRVSALAGLASVLGSGCWFTAMTLQQVAYVRTLGLVELLATFAFSVLWFREKTRPTEVMGIALIVASVAMILNAS